MMKNTQNAQVNVIDFEFNGIRYTNTRPNYYYKKVEGKQIRISKNEWDTAWDASGEAERIAREAEEAKKDAVAEKKTNGQKKARRSKDVVYATDWEDKHITLTAKQADFIVHLQDTCFWEQGLDSMPWCDVLADEIGGQFAGKPMTTGAMISTLREKSVITVGTDRVNGKKCKYLQLTDVGKQIARDLGLE